VIAWVRIALRNLVKNRRRSLITSLAIALGFAAVNLFGGFTEYMYHGNRDVAIFAAAQGHVTVFKKGFLEQGQLDPGRYLITPEEMQAVKEICRKDPHVILVTPELTITGLVTNGKVSTIFIAQGVVPSAIDVFLKRTRVKVTDVFKGKKLEDDAMQGVGMASGLARLLDLHVGSTAVAFTNTVDGQMNALDLEVFQIFDTASDQMNDKVMRVPLSFAQALYDTDRADRLAILLDNPDYTEPFRKYLQTEFAKHGLNLIAKTWDELSQWYRKVKDMFDVIFMFLFVIVFIIVIMSVVNTMSMAVLERTREIGTLRALGLKRRGVVLLFSIESCLLGLFGTIEGLVLTLFGWWLVDVLKPTWIPPGITRRVPIRVEFVPKFMLISFFFLLALCIIASLIPARRAARQNVVEALGHV
jgi:putative ABC transport system permease protein